MSEIDKIVEIPDEALGPIVGGKLNEAYLEQVRILARQLKNIDISYKNALEWFCMQTEGSRLSDEEWRQIEEVVTVVYQE